MEYSIGITFIPNLVDYATYAKLCGINVRGVQKQVRENRIAFTIIDGLTLIDTLTSPPVKRLPRDFKPQHLTVNTAGINPNDLLRVSTLAQKNGITSDRFYRSILLGRLKTIMIMGEAFVYKSDPLLSQLLSSYSKDVNYEPAL